MLAKDVIRQTLDSSERILTSYINDLDDADLMLKPVPGMNPIAWQVGHLIAVERRIVEGVKPGSSPPLPAGFEEAHAREQGQSDDRAKFRTKDEYLGLFKAQRAATLATLDSLSDEQLDAPAQAPPGFPQTVGGVMNLAGTHMLMHVGQFVAVRRQIGKPIAL